MGPIESNSTHVGWVGPLWWLGFFQSAYSVLDWKNSQLMHTVALLFGMNCNF